MGAVIQKRIVIYPKGKVGNDICYILGFVGYDNSQILFVDDACSGGGVHLEEYAKIKKDDDVVLIASRKYFLELSQKLRCFDIGCEDGLIFVSQKLDEFFGRIAPPHKTVGVISNGPSGSKHRGDIESILKSNGVQVVFFCCSERERLDANDRIGDSKVLILNETEILKRVTFASIFISENGEIFHPSVTAIWIPHTVAFPSDALLRNSLTLQTNLSGCISHNDYIILPSKRMFNILSSYIRECSLEEYFYKIKPFGSPTLDRYANEKRFYEKANREYSRKILLCLNPDITSYEFADKIILELLMYEFRVLYRPHPMQRECEMHYKIRDKFQNNEDFVWDESVKIDLDLINQKIIMVSDISSLCYSYAVATKIPVILYLGVFWRDRTMDCGFGEEVGFYDKRIHKIANNSREVIALIKEINKNRESYERQISEYIQDELYNFGKASEVVAEFIMNILESKGWVYR